jgi:RNA polymerase sigma-70 factor (ECF subfamily)
MLQAWQGRGFWQGTQDRRPGALAGMIQAMSTVPQPRLLASAVADFGAFTGALGAGPLAAARTTAASAIKDGQCNPGTYYLAGVRSVRWGGAMDEGQPRAREGRTVTGGRAAARSQGTSTDGSHSGAGGAPVTRLRAVDSESYADWDAVYRDNIALVHRLMFAKVGNRPDAEDLTTEVFLATLRPLRLPASIGEVRAYLLATARTVLARYWARTLAQQVTSLTEDPEQALTAARPESAAAPQRAQQILAALPERYRLILQLRFLEACTVVETAQRMEISVANAKVLQHRAMRRAAEIAAGLE